MYVKVVQLAAVVVVANPHGHAACCSGLHYSTCFLFTFNFIFSHTTIKTSYRETLYYRYFLNLPLYKL
jgi:hypothetical protein